MTTPRCEKHPLYPKPTECSGCVAVAEFLDNRRKQQADELGVEISTRARQRAADRRKAVAECFMCDSVGYVNGVVCHHDVNAMLAGKKGIAKVRAAMEAARKGEPDGNGHDDLRQG